MFFWKFWKGEPSCSVDFVKTSAIFSGSDTNFSLSSTYCPKPASLTSSSQSSVFCKAESLFNKSVICTLPSSFTCILNKAPPYSTWVLRVPLSSSFILSVWTFTSAHRLVSPIRLVRFPATVFINCPTAVFCAVACSCLVIIFCPFAISFGVR